MADYIEPLAAEQALLIEPFLPPPPVASRPRQAGPEGGGGDQQRARPFVTLAFTTSLDSMLTHTQGEPTALSGPRALGMTHLLRSRHAAILVGAGTAVADDPGLNCRLAPSAPPDPSPTLPPPPPPSSPPSSPPPSPLPSLITSPPPPPPPPVPSPPPPPPQPVYHHPRPVILDPTARWPAHDRSKVIRLARDRRGLPPLVIVAAGVAVPPAQRRAVEAVGGCYLSLQAHQLTPDVHDDDDSSGKLIFQWEDIFALLASQDLDSVMVEGGGGVINALLAASATRTLVDSVVVTIAPTWLGRGGHVVSPPRQAQQSQQQQQHGQRHAPPPFLRLTDTHWHQLGEDVVLCGKMPRW